MHSCFLIARILDCVFEANESVIDFNTSLKIVGGISYCNLSVISSNRCNECGWASRDIKPETGFIHSTYLNPPPTQVRVRSLCHGNPLYLRTRNKGFWKFRVNRAVVLSMISQFWGNRERRTDTRRDVSWDIAVQNYEEVLFAAMYQRWDLCPILPRDNYIFYWYDRIG